MRHRSKQQSTQTNTIPSPTTTTLTCACESTDHHHHRHNPKSCSENNNKNLSLFTWYPELEEIKCHFKPKSAEAQKFPFKSELHRLMHDDNPYLFSGYRKLPVRSASRSFWSAFTLHNETMNIWTHAIFIFYWLYYAFDTNTQLTKENVPFGDRLALTVYVMTAMCTMTFSSIYHTWRMNSVTSYHWCLGCDLRGIILLLFGGIYGSVWFLMKQFAFMQWMYIGFAFVTGCMLWFWIPRMVRLRLTNERTIFFTFYSCISAVCFLHSLWLIPFDTPIPTSKHFSTRKDAAIAFFFYQAKGFLITGVSLVVRGLKGPERFFPYTFDIFGASHQLFHLIVAYGGISAYWGMIDLLRSGCFDAVPPAV